MGISKSTGIVFQYGSLIWMGIIVALNILLFVLFKLRIKEYILGMSKVDLVEFFNCDQACVKKSEEKDGEDESLIKPENEKPVDCFYVNKDCGNIIIRIERLKYAYFMHLNLMILFIGLLFIKLVITVSEFSDHCLKGYKCFDIDFNDVCDDPHFSLKLNSTLLNDTNSKLFCQKYGVESFSDFVAKLGVFTGALKVLFKANKYAFKGAFKFTVKLYQKLENKRRIFPRLGLIPFLPLFVCSVLVLLQAIKVPGKGFVYSDEHHNSELLATIGAVIVTFYVACRTAGDSLDSQSTARSRSKTGVLRVKKVIPIYEFMDE